MVVTVSARTTTILGVKSKFPCPICLVPNDVLWDLSEVVYLRRSRDGALRLIAKAEVAPSKEAKKKILREQSIHGVPVSDASVNQLFLNLTVSRTRF